MINSQENTHLAQTYDDVPYTSNVFNHCQPTRLHALAKIKGLEPAPLETATVLEIGCSAGGNLLPYAIRYPKSQLIGIDLSELQISLGKQMLQQVGVTNVELVDADISKVHFNFKFDYIICHGVFSWVPPFIRQAILKTIQDYLAPNGIAFISYNAYPGWKIKEISKDLMHFGSNVNLTRQERVEQSFETLGFVQSILERNNSAVSKVIANLFKETREQPKYYIAHEHFENYNNPLYFKDFINEIEQFNLAYVTDASKPIIYRHFTFKDDEYDKVCNYFNFKLEAVEQFMDFIDNRQFRSSVITHKSNLDNHNIKNHMEQYSLCHDFYNVCLQCNVNYIEQDNSKGAIWKLECGVEFQSTPLNDKLFSYLKEQKGTCKVQDIFDHLSKFPEYDEEKLKSNLWLIIHLNNVYLSFNVESAAPYGKKPKIIEKLRALIKFVKANPEITNLSDLYYRVRFLDGFTIHLSEYLDGTKTIKQLEKQIRQDFDSGYLTKSQNGVQLTSDQIEDQEIQQLVKQSLETLENMGYFNQY